MIYNPLEEYESKFKNLHLDNTNKFFESLVTQSKVDVEENRKIVKQHDKLKNNLKKLKRKLRLWKFLRVLMFITLILIPIAIWKVNPKIKKLKEEIENADNEISRLLSIAQQQMSALNALFTDKDAIKLIEETVPDLSFASSFSAKQERNMCLNYDFDNFDSDEQTTLDVLAGEYNENPFVFENKLIHTMGTEVYHGYRTISWTETYRDSKGGIRTRTRSQTLHASVVKPKPFYKTQVVLNYCTQGGPELHFTRDATHLDGKSEKSIKRYIRRGEKKLEDLAEDALKENRDFTVMSNTEFEVLFDALDRTDEVQFRTLFTPLAQTNMVDLIRSKTGYGDDFNFIKRKRTNLIVSDHSQNREINLLPNEFYSYSFDIIKSNFINKNVEFFKAVYFDFAPLWAIPLYQEQPVNSLKPLPDLEQLYSYKQCETLANSLNRQHIVHPQTKTPAILKSSFLCCENNVDKILITAHSYDIIPQIDVIPVHGGDGRWHNVPVHWDQYIPLKSINNFYVGTEDLLKGKQILAKRNNLCIYN